MSKLATPNPESKFQVRLDQFLAQMEGPYRVGEANVRVTPHFRSLADDSRMAPGKALGAIKRQVGPERFREIASAAARATGSRGYPADVRKVVQALIDSGGLDKYRGDAPATAIRRMMWHLGIGFDCRGYVGRAFLFARGAGGAEVAGKRYGMEDSSKFVFPTGAFRSVDIASVRAGDIIRLKPDANGRDHNVIVRSNRLLRADRAKLQISGRPVPKAFVERGWPNGTTPSVRVFEVDSSWGGGEHGDFGGVERRTWVHNEKSGLWGHWDSRGEFQVSAGPYNHRLHGAYRPKAEP